MKHVRRTGIDRVLIVTGVGHFSRSDWFELVGGRIDMSTSREPIRTVTNGPNIPSRNGISPWASRVPERKGVWLRNYMASADGTDEQRNRLGRILIVARPAYSRALSATLSGAGYEVHRTPDAAGAVDASLRLRPQLVIVSMDVPGSSGLDVAQLLRSNQPHVPVILLGMPGHGADTHDFVKVPYDIGPAMLLAAVEKELRVHDDHGEAHEG